jgi:multidrug resistance efflux pump
MDDKELRARLLQASKDLEEAWKRNKKLEAQLQEYKGKINLSFVCAQALTQVISELEEKEDSQFWFPS